MRAESGWLKGLNPTVALTSKIVVVALVLFGVTMTETASGAFNALRDGILAVLGWWYVTLVALSLAFMAALFLTPAGSIRLGKDTDRPEFSWLSWFAMLFAAGMGIGLVFWSVAEPVYHLADNPFLDASPTDAERRDTAMRVTFFHWGLHPWAIYGVLAAGLAYFAYRKDLPLTIRSALHPLIGDRIYGPIGHTADILAVIATSVGVATSLGFGVQQINAGLNILLGWEISPANQLILIVLVTSAAIISVASGLDKGIKFLSHTNVWLATLVLLFVASFGPTATLIDRFLSATGDYAMNVLWMSLPWIDVYDDRGWQASWTTFYWGWWISWSPFVGMFIARISRGRTIREFTLGVLVVPALVTFVWMSIMGGTALSSIANGDPGGIAEAVNDDVSLSLYALLQMLDPGLIGTIVAAAATILVAVFFITSADSGTLVITTILAMGHTRPPLFHRVLWGGATGAIAAVLLMADGLSALQAAAISAALPFSFVMAAMATGLAASLFQEVASGTHRGGVEDKTETPPSSGG